MAAPGPESGDPGDAPTTEHGPARPAGGPTGGHPTGDPADEATTVPRTATGDATTAPRPAEGDADTVPRPAAGDADTVPRPAAGVRGDGVRNTGTDATGAGEDTGAIGTDAAGEPETAALPPRWTGSAAVPPPGTRRRGRRFHDEDETWPVDVPPPRSPDDPPTLEWPAPPPTEVWPATPPPGPAMPPPGAATPPPGPAMPPPGAATPPATGGRRERRRRRSAPSGPPRPPVAAYPWPTSGGGPGGPATAGPPARPAPPGRAPSSRRRRWPWVLLVLGVLSVLCCCGCAGLVWPYLKQYPTTVTLPARAAGLSRLDDPDSRQVEARLKVKLRTEQLLAEGVFAGRYAAPGAESGPVTLFGTTGFHFSPDKDLDTALSGLTDQVALTGVRTVPAGDLGGFQRCGSGESDGTAITVCGWADHGSLAIGLFPQRDLDQGAQLLRELRAAVTHRANRVG